MNAYGVVMAGGDGTRFWPLSRKKTPKQLLNLSGKTAMINETIDRISPVISPDAMYIITNQNQAERLEEVIAGRICSDHILREPVARNTAACVGFAAAVIAHRYGDGVMCVFPSDHYIRNEGRFREVLTQAIDLARTKDVLVTIGIAPTYPATGFGYIRYDAQAPGEAKRVLMFKEKPDLETAFQYLASGDYVWNSGMFVWKASVILQMYKMLLPDLYGHLMTIAAALDTPGEAEVIARAYPDMRKISIDYGILEHAENVMVFPAEFGWSDIGSWDTMNLFHPQTPEGNVIVGDASCVESRNSVVFSSGKHVVLVGVDNLVVVETPDVVMVCRRSAAQDVKRAVETLEEQGRTELL